MPRAAGPHDKLTSILSFLDEAEESSRADLALARPSVRSHDEGAGFSDGASERSSAPRGGEVGSRGGGWRGGLAQDAAAFQSKVSLLEVEVRDKRSIIDALKRAVAGARDREKQIADELAREWDAKLQKQKDHYESGLERHLKLVDRLLNDKTELTKRCELFSEELKAVERKFQMKMEDFDEHACKDVARQKQNWMAAEKLKREAWEKEKVREIKEMTIKGLQPEVERILAERKQEKHKLEEQHRDATEALRREMSEHAQQQVRETREAVLRDHERTLDEEREAHRRKLRDEFERFNAQLQDERARCAADLLKQRREGDHHLHQAEQRFDAQLRDAADAEKRAAEAALEAGRKSALSAVERQHGELEAMREQLQRHQGQHTLALEQQHQEHQAHLAAELERSEAAVREQLTKERDIHLDMVMDNLSRQQVEEQQKKEKESAALLEAVRTESKEIVGHTEKQLEDSRAHAVQLETQQALLHQRIQDLQAQLNREISRADGLDERDKERDAATTSRKKEMEDTLAQHRDELRRRSESHERDLEKLREEIHGLRAHHSEQRAALEAQLNEATRREETVIGKLEDRVKRTVQAKDDQIAELQGRCIAADNKVREFEYLLARQREELLSGLTKDYR